MVHFSNATRVPFQVLATRMAWRHAKREVSDARRKEAIRKEREVREELNRTHPAKTVVYDACVQAAISAEYSRGRYMGD